MWSNRHSPIHWYPAKKLVPSWRRVAQEFQVVTRAKQRAIIQKLQGAERSQLDPSFRGEGKASFSFHPPKSHFTATYEIGKNDFKWEVSATWGYLFLCFCLSLSLCLCIFLFLCLSSTALSLHLIGKHLPLRESAWQSWIRLPEHMHNIDASMCRCSKTCCIVN